MAGMDVAKKMAKAHRRAAAVAPQRDLRACARANRLADVTEFKTAEILTESSMLFEVLGWPPKIPASSRRRER
jgi:hypothetical protein